MLQCASKGREEEDCKRVNMDRNKAGFKGAMGTIWPEFYVKKFNKKKGTSTESINSQLKLAC